jgi:hypothetical protein
MPNKGQEALESDDVSDLLIRYSVQLRHAELRITQLENAVKDSLKRASEYEKTNNSFDVRYVMMPLIGLIENAV